MPVFNVAPFVDEAIESILRQTHREFEFLIRFALINNMSYDMMVIAFRKFIRQPFSYYLSQNSSRTLASFDMISSITYTVLQSGIQAQRLWW